MYHGLQSDVIRQSFKNSISDETGVLHQEPLSDLYEEIETLKSDDVSSKLFGFFIGNIWSPSSIPKEVLKDLLHPDLFRLILKNDLHLAEAMVMKSPKLIQEQNIASHEVEESFDSAGNTLLHLCTSNSHNKAINSLVRAGVDHNDLNNEGVSPLEIAINSKKKEIIQEFLEVEDKQITGREIKLEKRIDSGIKYSVQVYKGTSSKVKEKVAVKVIYAENNHLVKAVTNEFKTLSQVGMDENIISYFDLEKVGMTIYIAMELGEGNLVDVFEKRLVLPCSPKNMMLQLVNGLEKLHLSNISHRNLKPSNVIIKQNKLKLTDFTKTKVLGQLLSTQTQVTKDFLISTIYCSPEILNLKGLEFVNNEFFKTADVYSLGLLMYAIATDGDHPFKLPLKHATDDILECMKMFNMSEEEYQKKKSENPTKWIQQQTTDFIRISSLEWDPLLEHLCRCTWAKKSTLNFFEESKRPSIQQVKDHPFFKEDPFWNNTLEFLKEGPLKELSENGDPKFRVFFDSEPLEVPLIPFLLNSSLIDDSEEERRKAIEEWNKKTAEEKRKAEEEWNRKTEEKKKKN